MAFIRKVLPEDNQALATVIRSVLIELGVPKVGTAYADPEVDNMFATCDRARNAYFVVEKEGKILGGAGIAPLAGEDPSICELQQMYFSPASRGLGLGKQMMDTCLAFAKENNYSLCYLETLPYMEDARKLYRKVGFKDLDAPMGNTGHYSCNLWMLKDL